MLLSSLSKIKYIFTTFYFIFQHLSHTISLTIQLQNFFPLFALLKTEPENSLVGKLISDQNSCSNQLYKCDTQT